LKLYIMRHGPAEDAAESGKDEDRALTPSGRDRVRIVAKALLDAREEPLTLFTSPLVRATQTAEIVAIVTDISGRAGTVEARRDLAPGGSVAGLVLRLASEHTRRVMVVGHEPDLSGLVTSILGQELGRPFEKAMVVGLHLSANRGSGRLRFVLEPKTLRFVWAPGVAPG
jgi:phosphohistidine phosphatase